MNSRRKDASIVLDVDGMHCASCTSRVENALTGVPGVINARANLALEQASVEFDTSRTGAADLLAAVKRAGYSASLPGRSGRLRKPAGNRSREPEKWTRRLIVAGSLLIPLALLIHGVGVSSRWWQLALATVLNVYVGWPFYLGAWRRLRHGTTNMDTLVALGTGVAYIAGVQQSIVGTGGMMFLDGAMILTFITLGRVLEAKAKGRASRAIFRLLDLSPAEANVFGDGDLRRLPLDQVQPGDMILIRPGEKVPLDSRVVEGRSALDQSWLTGESMPVERGPNDEILAGTINGQGALRAVVLLAADETALAQVIDLVRKAQESKADVEQLADRVVAWFVPCVLILATATVLVWTIALSDAATGNTAAVAVLVAACPCALGLATPAAVLVGSGRGAENGILIKQAHSLELAGRLTTIVLDKTGTVTTGKLQVASVVPADGVGSDDLLATAAAVERQSQHPIGDCIVAEAASRGLSVPEAENFELVPGEGIRATVEGRAVAVGNERLMKSGGIDIASRAETLDELRHQGATPLLVARDQKLLGIIAVSDTVAPGSSAAVESLHRMGFQVHMLTGDHRTTAEAVAERVGITHVTADMLPADKELAVRRLREKGEVVAMVGDGINDAPALAAADLGIAIGSGSDVAIEAADIVLVGGDLRSVVRAVVLSRMTMRVIRQNLAWAFLYNTLLLPPAAAGLLHPAAAAAAMAASSLSVVGNSLLLSVRKLPP